MITASGRRFKTLEKAVRYGGKIVISRESVDLAEIVRHCAEGEVELRECTVNCHGWSQEVVDAFFRRGKETP